MSGLKFKISGVKRLLKSSIKKKSFVFVVYTFLVLTALSATVIAANSLSFLNLPKPLSKNDFATASKTSIALGRLLFFDPILSGNKNISCGTCHHPNFSTTDGVSLSIGEGGIGLGSKRLVDKKNLPEQLIGRNAPALFNLGAKEFVSLFHDGRLEVDTRLKNNIRTPLGQDMMLGFNSILSAQAMFPIASADEMAGHYNENDIATAIRKGRITGKEGAWNKVTQRIRDNKKYVQLFSNSLSTIKKPADIEFTDIANAIADFIASEWLAIDSPFDRYLAGKSNALTLNEKFGMQLFYGKAGCSNCHSGALQTDHGFHAIAIPQFGPGKTARFESNKKDTGRFRVTGNRTDKYKFRTPSLRNIALTAPYGHNGAFKTLKGIIHHHLDSIKSLQSFDFSTLVLTQSKALSVLHPSTEEIKKIAKANEITPIALNKNEINFLIKFLHSLTDKNSGKGRLGIPKTVPSGLNID